MQGLEKAEDFKQRFRPEKFLNQNISRKANNFKQEQFIINKVLSVYYFFWYA